MLLSNKLDHNVWPIGSSNPPQRSESPVKLKSFVTHHADIKAVESNCALCSWVRPFRHRLVFLSGRPHTETFTVVSGHWVSLLDLRRHHITHLSPTLARASDQFSLYASLFPAPGFKLTVGHLCSESLALDWITQHNRTLSNQMPCLFETIWSILTNNYVNLWFQWLFLCDLWPWLLSLSVRFQSHLSSDSDTRLTKKKDSKSHWTEI